MIPSWKSLIVARTEVRANSISDGDDASLGVLSLTDEEQSDFDCQDTRLVQKFVAEKKCRFYWLVAMFSRVRSKLL